MRKLPVVLLCRRPSGCAVGQIRSTDSAVPRSQGGRFAIVTKRGAGCDGRGGFKRRMKPWRTAKSCGPDTPTLVSSLLDDQQATVAKEPGHRGEHEISRNTIAQGVPDCFGVPVVTCSCAFFICTRGCGCLLSTRHSLRPLFFEGPVDEQLGRIVSRERRRVSLHSSCPASSGASSTPRPLGSSNDVSGIVDRPVRPGEGDGESGCLKFESGKTGFLSQARLRCDRRTR
jgi:hypothetical protein